VSIQLDIGTASLAAGPAACCV